MNRLRMIVIYAVLALMLETVSASEPVSGTVNETIDVGTYVYVHLEESDTWLATSPIEVRVGDRVEFTGGALMKNFYSPKLERTFEEILFVTSVEVQTAEGRAQQAPDPHQGMDKAGLESMLMAAQVTAPEPGEIAPLEGGATIAEIHSGEGLEAGESVALRARVMKVSVGILGKNWVTLEDGTGSAGQRSLVASTSEMVSPGDLVKVRGVLRQNVDLGYGYNYDVLLEDASFTK